MESVTCMHPVTKPGAECKLSEGRGATRFLGEQGGQIQPSLGVKFH